MGLLCLRAEYSPQALDYLQAGINENKGRNFRSAEEQLRKAVQLDPRNPEAYNLLGFVAGLKEGDTVEFEVERGEKGLRATNVQPHLQNGNE